MRAPDLRLPAALTIALALAGCGLTNPYTTAATTTPPAGTSPSTATITDADPVPERGGSLPAGARATQNRVARGAPTASPQAALDRYATLEINWTAATVARVQRELAGISIDQARAQALQAAASYGHDSTLQASHVANNGTVVAIAPGRGPATGGWVIVTREITTGQGDYTGLPAQLHVTYAQLEHTRGGYLVSQWSPQT